MDGEPAKRLESLFLWTNNAAESKEEEERATQQPLDEA